MFAIFKRELRSYFTSLVGYVVIGVMLAFTGLYYSANCLVYGTSDFSTVLYSTTLVMLFLLPALTMRSFADERRNKTDQLLLTSPVGIPSIVMGKYFASWRCLPCPWRQRPSCRWCSRPLAPSPLPALTPPGWRTF